MNQSLIDSGNLTAQKPWSVRYVPLDFIHGKIVLDMWARKDTEYWSSIRTIGGFIMLKYHPTDTVFIIRNDQVWKRLIRYSS